MPFNPHDRIFRSTIDPLALSRAMATLLCFLLGFHFTGQPAGYDIDPSWSAVMSWGLVNGAKWGSDLIFTYGPLSFLSAHYSYFPATFALASLGQVLVALLFTWVLWPSLHAMRLSTILTLLASLFVFGGFLAGDVLSAMAFTSSFLALLCCERQSHKRAQAISIAAGILAGLSSLIKISFFPLWLAWLSAVAFMSIPRQHRTIAILASVVGAAVTWKCAGQTLQSIPDYLSACWQIVSGYGAGMQRPPQNDMTDYAGLATLVLAIVMVFRVVLSSGLSKRNRIALSFLASATLVLTFHAAYTRIDEIHLFIFLPLISLLLVLVSTMAKSNSSAIAVGGFVLAVATMLASIPDVSGSTAISNLTAATTLNRVFENFHSLVGWTDLRDTREQQINAMRNRFALPDIESKIGHDAVDIFKIGQGIVFLNSLNYAPRPIFQGYSAYTRELSQRNADFLESSRGPQWMLLDIAAKDQHLPASEDPLAFRSIISRFSYASEVSGLLLFRRSTAAESSIDESLGETKASMGERIVIPTIAEGEALIIQAELKKTWRTRLKALLLREPRLFVELSFGSGKTQIFRLIPEAARSGFVISPAFTDNTILAAWLTGTAAPKVVSVRLLAEPALGNEAFEDVFPVRWSRLQKASAP